MTDKRLWLCCLLILAVAYGQDEDEGDGNETPIDQLCENRPEDEYFRLSTDGDCREVVRCDFNSDINGGTRLAAVKCPNGLAFDLDRQTCDWKTNVKNCDRLERNCDFC